MPDPVPPDDRKKIGDAASLYDTDEIRAIDVPEPRKPAAPMPPAAPVSDGYDLEGVSIPDDDDLPAPVPIPLPTPVERPKPRTRPKPKVEDLEPAEGGSTEFAAEVSDVDPTWSRMGEWGPDAIRVGVAGLATLILAWMTLGKVGIGMWLLILMVGGAATVLLSYPMLITLERPVRITPEQAVGDFYAAASHHFPHYRRMWLLLSSMGRQGRSFSTFEQFRDHWKGRIERWKQAKGAGKFAPLKFEVDGFRADKSTGKETSKADYTVNIYLRDRESEGPIESVKMVHGLVKGPDRMWYLNKGSLAPESK